MSILFALLAGSQGPAPPAWAFLAFFCFFISIWLLVSFTISRKGWAHFARAYACTTRPSGTSFTVPVVLFASPGACYKSVVIAMATNDGLYLRVIFPFSAFHPPFLLPWSSITRIERIDGWLLKGYALDIQDPVGSFHIRSKQSFESELRRFVPKLLDTPVPSTFPFIK